jgi:acyl-CoA reductase-like NAD-dependent aldehyde dehydrogenase
MEPSQSLEVVQAFDRKPFACVPVDNSEGLEAKLTAAHRAFGNRDEWLQRDARGSILQKAANLLESRRDQFSVLIAREGGKPRRDADIEVLRAIDGLRNAAEQLRVLAGREIPMELNQASEQRWAFTTHEPIGVVAAISAFNHPLNLIVHQVAPAIAVGCPVIVKPATATPLCCLQIVELLREAGLPTPWCQTFVTADNGLSERLATDSRVAFLSFIGSARVGWHLRGKLAAGTRCALEHGGAAPVIVDESADVDRAIEPIVKGGYYHAGQVCVSVQRIFVHRGVKDDFLEKFAARVASLKVGDPQNSSTEVGPLIHPHEAVRVASWIAEAVASGAVIVGGGRMSETTILPAILVEPPLDAKVSRLEIFGPVTCVYGFDDLDRAIEIANSLPFAFQASIFAEALAPALRAAHRLDASTVLINDHTAFRTDWMPFSGRRQSGYGVGGIPGAMHEMSQEKMIVLRHGA